MLVKDNYIKNRSNFKRIMSFVIKVCMYLTKKLSNVTLYTVLRMVLLTFVVAIIVTTTGKVKVQEITKQFSEDPVIVWWTKGFPGTQEIRHCPNNVKCRVMSDTNSSQNFNVQAYLFYGSCINFDALPLPRNPAKVIWGLNHEESPRNTEELMHEPILNLFNFSSTFSRYSDVPFPLQYLDSVHDITSKEYFVETTDKNKYMKEIAPILYLQSDCETSTERDAYVKELMKLMPIDSYGQCLNNKKWDANFKDDYLNSLNDIAFLNFIARYKFVIAFENGVCNDYVTEKLWRAVKVGSVPIYFGSPSIADWLPNKKSAILLQNYTTPQLLKEHLDMLLQSDELYEQYLEHKTMGLITNTKLQEELIVRPNQSNALVTVEFFECLICNKIHERLSGDLTEHVVTRSHYDCPKPISALGLSVNPENDWVYSWNEAHKRADKIYKKVMQGIV